MILALFQAVWSAFMLVTLIIIIAPAIVNPVLEKYDWFRIILVPAWRVTMLLFPGVAIGHHLPFAAYIAAISYLFMLVAFLVHRKPKDNASTSESIGVGRPGARK